MFSFACRCPSPTNASSKRRAATRLMVGQLFARKTYRNRAGLVQQDRLDFNPRGGGKMVRRRGAMLETLISRPSSIQTSLSDGMCLAQTCSLSVSVQIVAGRDDFAERGSVSRSTLRATDALDLSNSGRPATLLRVTDPRSLGSSFAALRSIADLHSARLWERPTRRNLQRPAEYHSATQQIENSLTYLGT